jgi:hypothetical protein
MHHHLTSKSWRISQLVVAIPTTRPSFLIHFISGSPGIIFHFFSFLRNSFPGSGTIKYRKANWKCRHPGSNRGPSDLRSDALPTELSRPISNFNTHVPIYVQRLSIFIHPSRSSSFLPRNLTTSLSYLTYFSSPISPLFLSVILVP